MSDDTDDEGFNQLGQPDENQGVNMESCELNTTHFTLKIPPLPIMVPPIVTIPLWYHQ